MLAWPDPRLPEQIRVALVGPGGPYELVEEDVLGARLPVFRNRPRSMAEILLSGVKRFGTRPYVVFPDRTLTFESIIGPVAAVAHSLRDKYGIEKGDRVAIVSANRVEYLLTFWAATVLGAVTVALNGWWTGPEMAYALELTRPQVLLGDGRRLGRLEGFDLQGLPVAVLEEDFASLEAAGSGSAWPEVDIQEDDPYVILFTSGTTGRPKGAMISHRSNVQFGLATELRGAELTALATAAGNPPAGSADPRSIASAPMFHVGGLTCTLAISPRTGVTMIYPPPGRWTEETHLRLTVEHQATAWSLVPTQLWRLLDWPDLGQYDLSCLRRVAGGSAVWAPELLNRLEHKLPWVRPGMSMGFGMTETTGYGTTLSSSATYDHPDSIGEVAPTMQVEIRDPVTRRPCPEGAVGEIALRGATTFLGYWQNPEATAAAFDRDRWYHTGDYGHIEGRFVYLQGRRSDMIIRGGENIYPVEIENRLVEHPAVAEVAVVGVEHPTLGEEVKAYVVLKEDGKLSAAEAQAWCAATLAAFKVPTQIEFLSELPHNATGKVVKHLIGKAAGESDFVPE
jgi:acyl-CoA synthetase (AMP-forming)/AMP-acid ligase II